jgi:hypothetical protein
MRLFMPIAMIAVFVLYVAYLAFLKKDLKRNLATVVYPGAFFIAVWGVCYMAFLR